MARSSKKFCSTCLKEVVVESVVCPDCRGPLTVLQSRDLVGEILDGRFEILELLGKGGMGIVYRARHRYLERDCAIKVLRADVAEDPKAVARFLREAKSVSSLTSPNTVRVSDFGVSPDGLLYLVMELLEGESLSHRLQRTGNGIAWQRAFHFGIQVCRSLAEAHTKQLWHRDIKPDNIFIVREQGQEVAKVLDFGIAKWEEKQETVTEAGVICGTPEYLSPEQARGREVDGRTDIYSLGAVLYESLAGHPPFEGDTAVKILMGHIMDKPIHLSEVALPTPLPEQVANLVMWTLKKKPRRRPATVEEFAAALQETLATLSGEKEGESPKNIPSYFPTGVQYAPMPNEEDTSDEVLAEDEETTGEFMLADDRENANLALMQEATMDSVYVGQEERTISSTKSLEPLRTGRMTFLVTLLGIAVALGLGAFIGWYAWSNSSSKSSSVHLPAGNTQGVGSELPDVTVDLATPPNTISPNIGTIDTGSDQGTAATDVVAGPTIDIATSDETTRPDVPRIAPTDASALGDSSLNSVVDATIDTSLAPEPDAVAIVDDSSTQDIRERESAEEESEKRRRDRHEKRAEEKRRREKEQQAAEELRRQNEKLKQEEARKLEEKAKEKAKEKGKEEEKEKTKELLDSDDDDDDDYSRIPGGG